MASPMRIPISSGEVGATAQAIGAKIATDAAGNPVLDADGNTTSQWKSHFTVEKTDGQWGLVFTPSGTEKVSIDQVAAGDAASALLAAGAQRMGALAHWWTTLGGIRDIETHTELELQTIRWHKLCINAAFNPGAVLSGGLGNADQLRDPELRRHLVGVMREIWDAAPAVLGRPAHRAQARDRA